ncbi:MAG: hypothetical protein A3B91_05025 [Candidatus Yanofskybacteria bacterium RIFCSPHIGHO2_02_FULL_41_29]|uniref:Uncharacterized protein n=2 Tax=Patescibacteria group TaxID=1783273 RepID=A0A1F5NIG4_9BACT|nr:MAG: hypothetical protein A3J19_03205 [Candidatus Daviesbacteria bacterium RIFCSPLOWO2_02_FULL_41_8]OGN00708.1 MAG: hypothetical protein A2650_04025 [Candidatus Yanofskybacteria bacterium RIFCSPHIGHO2_01_FULL_41_53]OGN11698.1 MAG: hypothetical protein A3B91_05025 [Candidatus Yanofskybacteria bacterium RIFCSPHIGHO2_02_FULL_41_29]OGN23443.1 MAG: hypothetical protein A2916_03415 [Candidatus Yanofskybacteria bacterium RIFCSPLOWO2_01_FULL_41_67]
MPSNSKNLWLLTEERPKVKVIEKIIQKFSDDKKCKCVFSDRGIKIVPIVQNGRFTFTYKVLGIECGEIKQIFIKTVSGKSSFVDFLLFYQDDQPDYSSTPIYAIEETKTDDTESRNTGIYQRSSKFVFVEFYYPDAKKIMLYNIRIAQNDEPSDTNIFGTRMLLTLGVEIIGKKLDPKVMTPFKNLDELIAFKRSMRRPPAGNTPILIDKEGNKITVSGRLYKAGNIGHDPNIGALSAIASCIRKWDNKTPIEITSHGLKQKHIHSENKFIQIANKLGVTLKGLTLPASRLQDNYWHYAESQEKVASIFVHLIVENFTNGRSIYENHGGSERGYFINKSGDLITIPKYKEDERVSYKAGNKNAIIYIPDLILFDVDRNQIINIEGKTYANRANGIEELKNYVYIEERYIVPSYKPSKIVRTVVLSGSDATKIENDGVGFILNSEGQIIISDSTPEIIKEAVGKLSVP